MAISVAGGRKGTVTTTVTNVEDRRIAAEGGGRIAADGGTINETFNVHETFITNDSETAQRAVDVLGASSDRLVNRAADLGEQAIAHGGDLGRSALEALRDTSNEAIRTNADLADGFLEESTGFLDGVIGRAFDLVGEAGEAQAATTSAALATTASEGNQALQMVTRAAMVIAGAFFVAQIFRG